MKSITSKIKVCVKCPIVETEEDLYEEIEKIDNYFEKYAKKYEKFNKKYNYLDDANSSERVINEIIKGD